VFVSRLATLETARVFNNHTSQPAGIHYALFARFYFAFGISIPPEESDVAMA
jgi:hypothetical protein